MRRILVRTLLGWLRERGESAGIPAGRSGAVVVAQRPSSPGSRDREEKSVGRDQGGTLIDIEHGMHGWHLVMDEQVDWQLFVTNPDSSRPIKVIKAKPYALGPPWAIASEWEVKDGMDSNIGRMDNEDAFFFVRRLEPGTWKTLNGRQGASDALLTTGDNGCNMYWRADGGNIEVIVWAH